jgi:hypothetical protein
MYDYTCENVAMQKYSEVENESNAYHGMGTKTVATETDPTSKL